MRIITLVCTLLFAWQIDLFAGTCKITATASYNYPVCTASNGSITMTPTGGTAPYNYRWSTGDSVATLLHLPSASYSVTITDAALCTATRTFSLAPVERVMNLSATTKSDTCNMGRGKATVIVISNGNAPFRYVWSNTGTTSTVSGLVPNTYNVVVTDSNGCTTSASAIVANVGSAISIAGSPVQPICPNTGGRISVIVSGGTNTTYHYYWSNSSTSSSINNLTAGNYNLTVTGSNSCSASSSYNVSAAPAAISFGGSVTQPVCSGNTGSISINPSGGTGPSYSAAWSNGSTSNALSGLVTGNYTVTLTDQNSCTASQQFTINTGTVINPAGTVISPVCTSENGSIQMNATAGTAPYNYNWATGDSTSAIANLAAGNYTVTVTDANLCSAQRTFSLTTYMRPVGLTTSTHVDTCGSAKGKASVNVTSSASAAPFSYVWSTGGTAAIISGLTPATYHVSVTDANGCSATANATVNNFVSTISANGSSHNPICTAHNGNVQMNPVGGTAAYSYVWSNGSTGATATGLASGTYTVTVTDANTCTATRSFSLTVVSPRVAASAVAIPDTCSSNRGKVIATMSGGTSPFHYLWSNGGTTGTITGLGAHFYTVVVTDTNGCSAAAHASVSEIGTPIVISGGVTQPLCYASTGSIAITLSGGISNSYSVLWSNGSTANTLSGLQAGTYTVAVSGQSGCTAARSYNVVRPDSIKLQYTVTDVKCDSAKGGTIILNSATGASAPYTAHWTGSNSYASSALSINHLSPGNYALAFSDAHGCSASATYQINSSGAIRIATTSTASSCAAAKNGIASVLSVSPYSTPITYNWSGPAGFSASTASISSLAVGVYNVTVAESFGCSAIATDSVKLAAPVSLSYNVTNVNCSVPTPGALTETAITGATYPWSLQWTGPNGYSSTSVSINHLGSGSYSFNFTDAHGCTAAGTYTITAGGNISLNTASTNASCLGVNNGSASVLSVSPYSTPAYSWTGPNGFTATTNSIQSLATGTYVVTVTEGYGCSATATKVVGLSSPITVLYQVTDIKCDSAKPGALTVQSITGATYPWSAAWTGPNGFTSTSVSINHLNAGSYNLSLTDAHGCMATASYTVNTTGSMNETYAVTNTTCTGASNGSVRRVSVHPYSSPTFHWTGPNGYSSDSSSIKNLVAGVYTVVVSEGYGCSTIGVDTVNDGPAIGISYSMVPVKCDSAMGGALTNTSITGATYPWTAAWTGPNGFTSSSVSLNRIAGGNYHLNFTDALGCTASKNLVVDSFGAVSITYNVNDVHCAGTNSGSINYVILSPYSHLAKYNWSGTNGFSDTAQSIGGLAPGNYNLTVTEDFGCKAVKSFHIAETFDVGVASIKNINCPAPGMLMYVHPIAGDMAQLYGNHCATGITGQVQLSFTGAAHYQGVTQGGRVPDVISGNTFTWNIADFGNLRIDSSFFLALKVDTDAVLGSQLCVHVSVTPTNGDYNTSNNSADYCMVVIRAYDPNEKSVVPEGNIDPSPKYLTYTVMFQNTGTATAHSVYILDTLDAHVDAATFKILASSHPVQATFAGSAVRFNFPDIILPDSGADQAGSRGWVQYMVKTNENILAGTEINNTAYIFFDFNAPIVTNTTLNKVVAESVTGIATVKENNSITLFPNPAHTTVFIKTDNDAIGGRIEVIDAIGRKCVNASLLGSTFILPVNTLAQGVYLVNVIKPSGVTATKKLLVE